MATNVKKVYADLDQSLNKINKAKKQLQYTCDHQRRPSEPDLDMVENQKDHTKAFRCNKCKKLIKMAAPTNKEVEEALDTFETMTDYIRLMADTSEEKGKKTCEMCGEIMMRNEKIAKSYKALRDEEEKKAKKNKDRKGQHSNAYFET